MPTAQLDEIMELFKSRDRQTLATLAGAFFCVFKENFPRRVISIKRFKDMVTVAEVKEALKKFSGFNVDLMNDEGISNSMFHYLQHIREFFSMKNSDVWHLLLGFFHNSFILCIKRNSEACLRAQQRFGKDY